MNPSISSKAKSRAVVNAITLVFTGALGLALWATWSARSHRMAVPTAMPVAIASAAPTTPSQAPASDSDPTFPTAEQNTRYYEAVMTGEQRSLEVVEQALTKARSIGGSPERIAKLEAMRATYQERIAHHATRLKF
jgi:hypothetical protein